MSSRACALVQQRSAPTRHPFAKTRFAHFWSRGDQCCESSFPDRSSFFFFSVTFSVSLSLALPPLLYIGMSRRIPGNLRSGHAALYSEPERVRTAQFGPYLAFIAERFARILYEQVPQDRFAIVPDGMMCAALAAAILDGLPSPSATPHPARQVLLSKELRAEHFVSRRSAQ